MLVQKIRRNMLRLKSMEARKSGGRVLTGLLAAAVVMAGTGHADAQAKPAATGKLGPAAPVTHDNRYEIYGGLNFMNFQAGQKLTTRMNMGGGEFLGTYWLTNHLGLGLDYRGEAGTTPVFPSPPIPPNPNYINRPLVYMNMLMAGGQYRGPRNQHAALNYHAYIGASKGVFDGGTGGAPPQAVGLYTNRTKPIAALGASVDFNRSKNLAIRLQPDLILEHFGTETREFFAISGGVIYRFGKK